MAPPARSHSWSAPVAGGVPASSAIRRQWLYERLAGRALPLVAAGDAVMPAASLWMGTKLWVRAFREAGLRAGDRVVLALPAGPSFVQVLVAAMWEGLTLALAPPSPDAEHLLDALDARLCVGTGGHGAALWEAEPAGAPRRPSRTPTRPARTPGTAGIRFLLRTSGTTGEARWIALSDGNVEAVVASHRAIWPGPAARVVSALPWHHAFGLVLELLPALRAGAEIIRDPLGGRDPEALASLLTDVQATHFSAVPMTVRTVAGMTHGMVALQNLAGGVVGGAPITEPVAEILRQTRLRIGYGQTEASPGITLGEPGEARARFLGRPVGCRTRIEADGVLAFRGPNAAAGEWTPDGLHRLDPERWARTGDLVRSDADGYTFEGRADAVFKLPNGRALVAARCEDALCRALPAVHAALVSETDGGFEVWLQTDAPTPSLQCVADALGSLGPYLRAVRALPAGRWECTPKGETDRRATLAAARHRLTGRSEAA